MQVRRKTIVSALELRLSCTKPSTFHEFSYPIWSSYKSYVHLSFHSSFIPFVTYKSEKFLAILLYSRSLVHSNHWNGVSNPWQRYKEFEWRVQTKNLHPEVPLPWPDLDLTLTSPWCNLVCLPVLLLGWRLHPVLIPLTHWGWVIHIHQLTRWSLDQIMACCLFGPKPLSDPMVTH